MKNGIKKRLVVLLPVSILVLVTVLSLMPPDDIPKADWWFRQIPHNDKIVHFCFYFLLISCLRFARTYFGKYDKFCPWKLLIMAAVYGGLIELLQGKYFGRGCDIWDEAANVLGAIVAIWVIPQNWHIRITRWIGRL